MKDIAKLVKQNKLKCIKLLKEKTRGSLEFTEEKMPIMLANFGKRNTEFYIEKICLSRNIVTNKAEIAFLITEVNPERNTTHDSPHTTQQREQSYCDKSERKSVIFDNRPFEKRILQSSRPRQQRIFRRKSRRNNRYLQYDKNSRE